MRILSESETAILWILDPGEYAKKNLINKAIEFGVAKDKILFAPKLNQDYHLSRLQHCDLVLDPWPYGGHTTTTDALFAGVPVIALEGSNFASRVSGGLLMAAHLGNLIFKDIQTYIDTAIRLIKTPKDLAEIKSSLIANKRELPIFDSYDRTLKIERAYKEIYARLLNNQSMETIDIKG
jgi:predicted O-linked N-acetylglucosamine transferase (SPINDLY family)